MTVTDRTDAPAPSPAEQAVIERFGIFAEERVIEEVARALHGVEMIAAHWDELREIHQTRYRRLAAAAVVAYRAQDGGAEEARHVRTALVDVAEDLEWAATKQDRPDVALGFTAAAGRVRERLEDAPVDGGAEEAVRLGAMPADERDAMCLVDRTALAPQAGNGAR